MKQKRCELCEKPAKIYCESDRANLCWDCDRMVHGANFLVARHSRTLLCHACQSPTPWRASGSKLTPSVSVCGDCVAARGRAESTSELGECNRGGHGYHGSDSSDDDEEDEDDEDEDEEDEDDEQRKEEEDHGDDEENQVVPWDSSPPLHPISRSSSSDEESTNRVSRRRENISVGSRKRRRPQR